MRTGMVYASVGYVTASLEVGVINLMYKVGMDERERRSSVPAN